MSGRSGILVVSTSVGSGHLRAAEAVRVALRAAGEERAEHVDILQLAPGWVRHAYGGAFEVMARRAPWMWRELYTWTDGLRPDVARWGPLAQRLLFRAFRRLVAAGPWEAVICTHFLPCQLVSRRSGFPPLALAVTDFTLHRYWLQPAPSLYFVATEAMAAEVHARTGARAVATGIPVMPGFGAARAMDGAARAALRADLGFAPRTPLALVMGGSFGLGLEAATGAALRSEVRGLQLAVVCGHNSAARARLHGRRLPPHRLRVLGHVPYVDRLMAAADVVITKPGGLSTSEALAAGRPLLLTRPVPGHEEVNLREMVRRGAALHGDTPDRLRRALTRLFGTPGLLPAMTERARAAGRPDAAATVAQALLASLPGRAAA